MQNLLDTLFSQHLLAFWVLLCVMFVERYILWPDKYHPISFIQLLAQKMADKVLPTQHRSVSQQKISGALACIVLMLPFFVTLAVLLYLSEYPLFFEALALLIALRFQNVIKTSSKVSVALRQEKKMLARNTLTHIVLRETDKMSPLGMAKSNIESLLLRYCYQYCSVIFWYALTGGFGAITYRILFEFSLCWNVKLERFKHFGLPVRNILNILQWVPAKLMGISFILAENVRVGMKVLRSRINYQSHHFYILNMSGTALGIELGGPAYYDRKKIRVAKCGGQRQVVLDDIERVLSAIKRSTWVWSTSYFLLCALYFYFAKK